MHEYSRRMWFNDDPFNDQNEVSLWFKGTVQTMVSQIKKELGVDGI